MPSRKNRPSFFPELYRRVSEASEIWLADGPSERLKKFLTKSARPLAIYTGRMESGGPLPVGSALSLRHSLMRMHPDDIFLTFSDVFEDFPEKKILILESAIGEGFLAKRGRTLGSRAKIIAQGCKPRRIPMSHPSG